ncbi:MAG: hypothetical protein DRI61_15825 [Chloroflexi bacterium]|nr:MAG: hypothetical protein DRI61_15825 [Chloroflexota bacterium]
MEFIHRNSQLFTDSLTPTPHNNNSNNIEELLNYYLLLTKVKNYKKFEEFVKRYSSHFNKSYIKAFKIVYLRDWLGFKWKEIALLVKKKRTTCIEAYKRLKKNPSLLFK